MTDALSHQLVHQVMNGDFHIGFRAPTTLTDHDDFKMTVNMTIEAVAYCH